MTETRLPPAERWSNDFLNSMRQQGDPLADGVIADLFAKGEVGLGETRQFESIAGSRFAGEVVRETQVGAHGGIVAKVAGRSFYSGRAEFWREEDDELGDQIRELKVSLFVLLVVYLLCDFTMALCVMFVVVYRRI